MKWRQADRQTHKVSDRQRDSDKQTDTLGVLKVVRVHFLSYTNTHVTSHSLSSLYVIRSFFSPQSLLFSFFILLGFFSSHSQRVMEDKNYSSFQSTLIASCLGLAFILLTFVS